MIKIFFLLLFLFIFNCYRIDSLPQGSIKTEDGYKHVQTLADGSLHIRYWNKQKIMILEKKILDGVETVKYYDKKSGLFIREFRYEVDLITPESSKN